ncbi:hypothetical protein HNQ77_000199 [Silvibacterium bohemicum]|uniref:DUF4254 domain-containing protein n=1 Tax=Silvibacterium bohemicum TaxID=1577686 RepID=A0A841JTH6_9BACT|nr:DUF4254 domain-containing protein [Silvibacterium bohemicum]MBB6142261.1 hypothetical protein [Silvibacterium bohemicum]
MTASHDNPLLPLLSAPALLVLQDSAIAAWHGKPAPDFRVPNQDFPNAVLELHRANFDLWHIEDQARAPEASDRQIADTKRAVDRTNQRRNDLAESCDAMLLDILKPHGLPRAGAELHSESPGLMLDRLSILALKIYHTREEIDRANAPEGHAERNRERLVMLESQRGDLADGLDAFWKKVVAGERRFKLYRQLKMYNDPSLNPAVYLKSKG